MTYPKTPAELRDEVQILLTAIDRLDPGASPEKVAAMATAVRNLLSDITKCRQVSRSALLEEVRQSDRAYDEISASLAITNVRNQVIGGPLAGLLARLNEERAA